MKPSHGEIGRTASITRGYRPDTIELMIHEVLPVGMLQCNCSIFGDEQSREAIVIDPGDNIDDILAILRQHTLTVKAIVITHAHIDHIGGAAKLKAATGAPVFMNQKDQTLYDDLAVQASWLGMETPERTEIDSEARVTATRSPWALQTSTYYTRQATRKGVFHYGFPKRISLSPETHSFATA